jgi:hypothetical protein
MASIDFFAFLAMGLGLIASATLGWKSHKSNGFVIAISALFGAVALGVALMFGAGFLHVICESALKFCSPTTHDTVWSATYPILFSPFYWLTTMVSWGAANAHYQKDDSLNIVPTQPATSPPEDLSSVDKALLGSCPNCHSIVRLIASECVHCKAIFGPSSSWKIERLLND